MTDKFLLIAEGLFIAALWAVSTICNKKALSHMNPEATLCATVFVTFCLTLVFMMLHKEKIFHIENKWNITTWTYVITGALIGNTIAYYLYYKMLSNHPSYLVTALTYTSPLMVTVFAMLFLSEQITLYSWLGVICIIVGVLLVAK